MTVNIGLVTSDSLVLGCDSVASTTDLFLDPFKQDWERDDTGEPMKDAQGRFILKFKYSDLSSLVTNAWGGVTKMFEIHKRPLPVVAVTSGIAKLNNRPIDNLAGEFLTKHADTEFHSSEEVCQKFLEFMRQQHEKHYLESRLPENLREGPEFLIGGYGESEEFPSLFRVKVKENTIAKQFVGGGTGLAWNGQSDAVERFVRGFDDKVRIDVARKVDSWVKFTSAEMQKFVVQTVNNVLDKLGQKLPDGMTIASPSLNAINLNWDQYWLDITYANLPLQDAIDLVAFLVSIQSSKSRFARGVPTVGGRTHIGYFTKQETRGETGGFKFLDEPKITHRFTGYGNDAI